MRKFSLITFTMTVLFVAGYPAGAAAQKSYISAKADWEVNANLEQFNKSFLGQMLKSEISRRGWDDRLKKLSENLTFNPIDDLKNIIIYGQGVDSNKAVVLIQGKFDRTKLKALVEKNPDYKKIQYNQVEIDQWTQLHNYAADQTIEHIMFGCFYDDDLIVLSASLPELENAIDILKELHKGSTDDFLKNYTLTDDNIFFYVKIRNVSKIVGDKEDEVVLKMTDQLTLSAAGTENKISVKALLKAQSQEATESIVRVYQGTLAYLTLAGQVKPEIAEWAQKINISRTENIIEVSFETESDLVGRLVRQLFPMQ